jgi:hypothetical protein
MNPAQPDLLTDIVEHAMRICGDESAVAALWEVAPGSVQACTALGRLLTYTPARLGEGTPLLRLADPSAPVDDDWRQKVDPGPDSLWERLQLAESLWGTSTAPPADPLCRLLNIETVADTAVEPPSADS